MNEVALGFINAMKLQALQDCDGYIASYDFTRSEYQDSRVHIRVNAAARAPRGQLVRCNCMFAIKTLAIDQLTRFQLYGATFTERYRGQLLYRGVFDDRINVLLPAKSSNSSNDPSRTIAQDKRAMSIPSSDLTNSSTTLLTIPGAKNDDEYEVQFEFKGRPVPKVLVFTAVLENLMALAQQDSGATINTFSLWSSLESLWIFVTHDREAGFDLQVFQVLAILESVARHAVNQNRYQEMVFRLRINGVVVANGCLTAPLLSRLWCRGLEEGSQEILAGSLQSS